MKGNSQYHAPSIKSRGYHSILSELAKSSRERVSLQSCSTPSYYSFEDFYQEKRSRESCFSDLGLFLLGFVMNESQIQHLERRLF